MNHIKYILSIIVLTTSAYYSQTNAVELTVFAYLQNRTHQTKQLLAKIILSISEGDTLASIKQKILEHNTQHKNCLQLPEITTADQLPDLRHMSRTQSPFVDDEIALLKMQNGAAVSIIFCTKE